MIYIYCYIEDDITFLRKNYKLIYKILSNNRYIPLELIVECKSNGKKNQEQKKVKKIDYQIYHITIIEVKHK